MSEPAHRLVTYEDVLRAPEGVTAEIIAGDLYLTPRPGGPHTRAATSATIEVGHAFGRRPRDDDDDPGWVIAAEPELHLGTPDPRSEVLVPDLCGWRRTRLPELPPTPAVTVAPDWVGEVLSPGARNVRRDRVVKMDAWYRARVGHVWLIDPHARLVEVFVWSEAGWTRVASASGDTEARLPPFEAKVLDLSGWWLPETADDAD